MTDLNRWDERIETWSRSLAKRVSRRSILRSIGTVMMGAATLPLLPVARGQQAAEKGDGDDKTCEYWRYCGIDGFLCTCCGGTITSCPPGTEPAPITWVGTCKHASDGKEYVISYNDCCGKSACGRCFCNRNEGDRPLYQPRLANDYNWCVGSEANVPYHCTVSRILGEAESPS
jgi:methylamine dehydrogenase light chain